MHGRLLPRGHQQIDGAADADGVDLTSEDQVGAHWKERRGHNSISSVTSADRIYVLDQGSVVDHGSHAELMAKDGVYAELFTPQAAAYLAPTDGSVAAALDDADEALLND
ncbi:MAG TPA: hypothetical protein VMY34_02400 [Acidimicrobiales bacterium]|nr:hypothetical protein [Acidimicrobiales bacterium]